jgi:biotin-dependent carboxylase-like uncharacterized protein
VNEPSSGLRVVRTGALLTCQDTGRKGMAHWGVARSGAADRGALRRANRVVGNAEDAAGLEVLAGGAVLRAEGDVVVAVTGASCSVGIGARPEGRDVALRLDQGQELVLGSVTRGLRVYVAVRGGVDSGAVLGSRSYDQLGDLGPAPFQRGDLVPCGTSVVTEPEWEPVPSAEVPAEPVLRVAPGPRADWLDDGLSALAGAAWTVTGDVDRTGVRLDGPPLPRRTAELRSEGTLPGAVQVPGDGKPIVLGPDAGVTGGYPVVAVVVEDDLDLVGQLAPGTPVRFRVVSLSAHPGDLTA